MWPVIIRELQSSSRQSFTYWLRVIAALAVIAGAIYSVVVDNVTFTDGAVLFTKVHRILFFSIWLGLPLTAADCLSKERREGTLGLLFLTPLTARGIVAAKAGVHALRMLSLWAAAIPVVAVALLLGGIVWQEILMSIVVCGWAVCLATAATIVASAVSKRWLRAVFASLALSGVLYCAFIILMGVLWLGALTLYQPTRGQITNLSEIHLLEIASGMTSALINENEAWREVFAPNTALPITRLFIGLIIVLSLICLLVVFLAILFAGSRLKRNWQLQPKSERQAKAERMFCTPVVGVSLFHRWMKRLLLRNPIGWLEQRNWSGRLASLIWFAIMISFASIFATDMRVLFRGDMTTFMALAWMLVMTVAFLAAGSFRRERESGALELILVTRLTSREIVMGRLRGLWLQFFPAVIAWISIVVFLVTIVGAQWEPETYQARVPLVLQQVLLFGTAFFSMPVSGLYFSLQCRSVVVAWILTVVTGIGVPAFLAWCVHIIGELLWPAVAHSSRLWTLIAVQLLVASAFLNLVQRKLANRTFDFQR